MVCCSNVSNGLIPIPSSCFDYTSESSCIGNAQNVEGAGCPEGRICSCWWNSTSQSCSISSTTPQLIQECGDGFKCLFTPVNYNGEKCQENGFKTINVSATLQRTAQCSDKQDPDCINKEIRVPCGLAGYDLPFFGIWQFSASLISIALVYLLMRIRKDYVCDPETYVMGLTEN